jgi:hypothetical protein
VQGQIRDGGSANRHAHPVPASFNEVQPVRATQPAARFFAATSDCTVDTGWLTMPDGVRLAVDYYRRLPRTPHETFR